MQRQHTCLGYSRLVECSAQERRRRWISPLIKQTRCRVTMPTAALCHRADEIVSLGFAKLRRLRAFEILRHDTIDPPALAALLRIRYIQRAVRAIDQLHRMKGR